MYLNVEFKTASEKLIIFVLFVRHQEESDQPYRIHEKTEERKTTEEVAGGKLVLLLRFDS